MHTNKSHAEYTRELHNAYIEYDIKQVHDKHSGYSVKWIVQKWRWYFPVVNANMFFIVEPENCYSEWYMLHQI